MARLPLFPALLALALASPTAAQQNPNIRIGFTASEDLLAPLTVHFQAQIPAGSKITWNFDDGTSGTGPSITHVFYRPKTYAVEATITDAKGRITDSGTANIEVKSAGPERAALTLLLAPGSVRLSAAGSVSYMPHTARYWLDGKEVPLSRSGSTIKTEAVAVAVGPHKATVRIQTTIGVQERTLAFNMAPVATSAPYDAEVLRLTNAARAAGFNCKTLKTGGPALPPLTRDPTLDSAALAQSMGIALNSYFAHQSALDGSQPFERVAATGLVVGSSAENIAAGQPTPQRAVDAWLKSPGHCRNIMGDFSHIGLSYVAGPSTKYNPVWTQVFAKN